MLYKTLVLYKLKPRNHIMWYSKKCWLSYCTLQNIVQTMCTELYIVLYTPWANNCKQHCTPYTHCAHVPLTFNI